MSTNAVDPSYKWQPLPFAEEVLKAFQFLVTEFRYICTESTPTLVRYRSPLLWVEIFYTQCVPFEMGVYLAPPHDVADRTSGTGLHTCAAAIGKPDQYPGWASTLSELQNCARRQAEILLALGPEVLRGDKQTWDRINEFKRQEQFRYTLQHSSVEVIRGSLEAAWSRENLIEILIAFEVLDTKTRLTLEDRQRWHVARDRWATTAS